MWLEIVLATKYQLIDDKCKVRTGFDTCGLKLQRHDYLSVNCRQKLLRIHGDNGGQLVMNIRHYFPCTVIIGSFYFIYG